MEYFTYKPNVYATQSRDLNNLKHYHTQLGFYIHKTKQIDRTQAEDWVKWALKNNRIPYNDPMMDVLIKDDKRNRHRARMKYSEYLEKVTNNRLIMAPTMTCYLPASTMKSELADFTEVNFYSRKKTKKEGQAAKSRGDMETALLKDGLQAKKKEDINSISGAMSIATTPMANRSGHSTLTSVCRTATAFANANTERLFMGRRHLWNYESVIDNITGILAYVNLEKAKEIIDKFGFHYVTPDELYESLKYSWDSYMRSPYTENRIKQFIDTLSPLECSTYLYMGDFYHLRKYNDTWVRNHIDKLMKFQTLPPVSAEETKAELKSVDEFFLPLLSITLSGMIGTLSPFDPKHEGTDYYGYIGAYSKYLRETMGETAEYYDFFWRNPFIPAETALFPEVHRRAVLGGDTDSTLLTSYQWIDWYCGTREVNKETMTVAGIMIFYLSVIVKHTLAHVSGIIGVEERYIHNMKMKNEFFFDTFAVSNRTKHYASTSTVCEGILQREPEILLKGVALKNSKARAEIIEAFHNTMVSAMERIAKGEKIDVEQVIDDIAKIEASIYESIMHGSTEYLTTRSIKVKDAYAKPESSDYANYELWEEVFAPKYGHAGEPPYLGVRISMELPNKTVVNSWLDSLSDQIVADRFRKYMESRNRKGIASLILPYDVVVTSGIPDELKPIVNARKIIFANMEQFYIYLEMFNLGKINKWLTKLCLDDRLEYIREDIRPFYDPHYQARLDELRSSAKVNEYDDWDGVPDEETDDGEGDNTNLREDDE